MMINGAPASFNVPFPLHFILDAGRKVDVEEFKSGWVKIPSTNEFTLDQPFLGQSLRADGVIKRVFEDNYFWHMRSKTNAEGQQIHYFAARMVDGNLVLVELKIPGQNTPNGYTIVCKSNMREILPNFAKTIGFLLTPA